MILQTTLKTRNAMAIFAEILGMKQEMLHIQQHVAIGLFVITAW